MREFAVLALDRFSYFAMLYCVLLAVFYAFYLPLVLFGLSCIIRKETKTRAHWVLFTITVLTMIMTTVYTVTYLAHYLRVVALIDAGNTNWSADSSIINLSLVHGFIGSMTGIGPIFWINDGLVVWRALELLQVPRKSRFVIWSVLGALIGEYLAPPYAMASPPYIRATLVLPILSDMNYVLMLRSTFVLNTRSFGLMLSSQSLSVMVNVVATAAIAIEASKYRDIFTSSRAFSALFILAESGLIYILFQIFSLFVFYAPYIQCRCLAGPSGSGITLTQTYIDVIVDLMPIIAASYPIILLIAITYQFSIRDTIEFSQKSELGFVAKKRHTRTDSDMTLDGISPRRSEVEKDNRGVHDEECAEFLRPGFMHVGVMVPES